jgi:hypothetical protein
MLSIDFHSLSPYSILEFLTHELLAERPETVFVLKAYGV